MTIFETRYSVTTDQRLGPAWSRLLPLVRMEFKKIFRTRLGVLGFIVCSAYTLFLLGVVWFFIGDQSQDESISKGFANLSSWFAPFRRGFYTNFSQQFGFAFFLFLSCMVGVRSIAADRAANALEIYWTRGISPWGYFLAKWAGFFNLLALVFVGGPLLAWVFGLLTAPNSLFFETTIVFMPSVLLALTVKCLLLSLLTISFSALSDSPNRATFMWVLVIVGTEAIKNVLKGISIVHRRRSPETVFDEEPWFDAISPVASVARIEDSLAGGATVGDFPVWIACAVFGITQILLLIVLRRRLRTTEAVA